MIVKNGEILAIDHIAHDNTLSGNGTSAKPVGLSQSTKDLIDSKVKKTDFETYKSSAANQISNINTKITTDESNFESYKSSAANQINTINNKIAADEADFNSYKTSAHNEIARIDGSIAAVNAAKVDKTTFTQYQTDVANNFTAVNKRIDDVDAAKVSNTTFEQYQVDINNAFTAVDKKINDVDAAKQNKGDYVSASDFNTFKSSAHNEIARIDGSIAAVNAAKVNNTDFNAYKTEVAGKFTNTSAWANETFATKQNLTDTKAELEDTIESVSGEIISKVNTDYGMLDDKIDAIANTLSNDYYTSLEIDAILAASGEYYTKSESDTKYTEKTVFNTAINELSSNKLDKSATTNWDVTEYTEGENIKIVGHEISGKDWSDEIAAAVENKVDESELENYYTSSQIDGNFVTKTEFNELDNKVGAIDVDLDTLSGKTVTVIKDSETVKAIRSTEPDGTISYTLSAHDGKQADYLWKPTVNAAGDISWELALTGDTPDPANIKGPQGIQGISGTPGKNGENGITPKLKIDENDIWNVSYDNEETWTSLGVSATGPKGETGAQGPQGISGTPGKNGENGITPHIGNNNHWFIGDDDTGVSATGPQGPQGEEGHDGDPGFSPTVNAVAITDGEKTGTEITFTYKDAQGQIQTTVYSAWNGVNGEGATVHFDGIDGIKITPVDTTHFNVGLSADYKTAIESISADYAKTTDLNDYLKTSVAETTYQTKAGMNSYLTMENAEQTYLGLTQYASDSATFLVADSITGKVNITDFDTYKTSAHNEFVNTSSWANNKFQEKGNYVATADILTADSNKLTGIKVGNTNYEIPLFGGVTTDTNTITGDGNTNPLGVAWSALSGYTITSALSAGSASYAVALGTTASYSGLSDIVGAINDAKFTGVNIATGSSITGNGLSTNELGLASSAEDALTAVDNKLDKTAIVTATIDNTNYVTAVNINSSNIPIKDTNFWEVTAATGTTASNNTWQHYISTTNTFNYYKMVIHPNGTSSAQEWANDGIIHIILEA